MSTDDPETFSPEEEAVLRDILERGLDKYRSIAPPEALATLREVGADGLRTHPSLRALIDAPRQAHAAPDVSGDLPQGGSRKPDGEAGGEGGA